MTRAGAAILLVFCGLAPAAYAQDRTFSERFSINGHADMALIGNTLESCPAMDGACAGNQSNNNFSMAYVDTDAPVDPLATTFNSSTANLTLPAGAAVRFALLSWSGAHDFVDAGAPAAGDATPDPTKSGEVRFDTPAAAGPTLVQAVPADNVVADNLAGFANYAAVADVTQLVAAGGSGTYEVANVQAAKGTGSYAGWSLLVVYERAVEPLRNVTVFDGLESVNADGNTSADNVFDIAVSGFATPPSGTITSRLAVVAYDGDRGLTTGELFQLHNGTAFEDVSDTASPTGNQFNSSMAYLGADFSAKNPNFANQLGIDADVFDTSTILESGQTASQIRIGSSAETIYANVVAFATVLYSPDLFVAKTATDVNGGDLQTGDVIEYALTVSNSGGDDALAAAVTDQIPAGSTYVPGSITVDAGARTDASDGDGSAFASDTVTAGLPVLAKNASSTARFRVTVTAAAGATITNSAEVDATAKTGGFAVSAQSNPVSSTVAAAPVASVTPVPTLVPTPVPTPTVQALPSFASVVKLPSTRKCVSRRKFAIRLVEPRGDKLASAVVRVNGKVVKTIKGVRLRSKVDLRGLPKGRFTVQITATTASGRAIKGTRRYRTCAARRKGRKKLPV